MGNVVFYLGQGRGAFSAERGDMLLRRKRKEGKEGRKEVGREEDKGSHFSNCHSTCTPSLSGAWMVKERIQVGVMDSVIEN